MAARITSCVLQKGGTGKSSTTHALSSGLRARGYNVLTVDADPQCNISHTMQANTSDKGLFEVLNGEPIIDIIQRTEQGDVLANSQRLVGADKLFADINSEYLLADALATVKENYDYILIDCPPQLGILTINALVAATDLVIPITADLYALQGLALLMSNVDKVKLRANPELSIDGILLTKYSSRSVLSRDLKEDLEAQAVAMKTQLYKTVIREGVAVREAQAQRTSIFDYAPSSNPAKDYSNFIEEYLVGGVGNVKK
jgi:chromosome partitioning protein